MRRMADPKHLVRTQALGASDYVPIKHPLNPASEVHMCRLGDRVGTVGKVGVFMQDRVAFFDEASATVLPRTAWRAKT